MKRSIRHIENEIVHQIFFCELCFEICSSIEIIPGRGSDFLPYYYNLNFTKGLISLHSLLLSKEKNELSIRNFIREYKAINPHEDLTDFEDEIISISNKFKESFPMPLRHKIAAHIDESFQHTDFTSAYIMPTLREKYLEIAIELKKAFFAFCNYAIDDKPFDKIKEQSDKILKDVKD
jgi:hypothetical protein